MYAFVSVGQCGGGILDSVFEDEAIRKVSKALAINSATTDLMNLKNVRREDWLGLSRNGFLKGKESEFNSLISGGYGQEREKAEKDAASHYSQLLEFLSGHFLEGGVDTKKISCCFLVYGLGGGTGSGAGPVVASAFRDLGVPVIAVAVLPAGGEGSLAASNAYVSLKRISEFASSVVLVDNQRIAYTGNMANAYRRYNDYIARAIVDLVLGSAKEGIDLSKFSGNPPVIDTNDIITATTLKGRVAYSCIARSSERARNLAHYLFPIGGWRRIDVIRLLYEAFMKLSLEGAKPEDSEKNLALIRLPPHYLQSEGALAPIDVIRSFLSERSALRQTHLGVSLTKRNLVSAVLLFTYPEEKIIRISELRSQASHYRQEKPSSLSIQKLFLTKVDVAEGETTEVEVGGMRKAAGSVFALPRGKHELKVFSGARELHRADVSIEGHSQVSIVLSPQEPEQDEFRLEVSVLARGKPVQDAEVIVGESSLRTGAEGKASFSVKKGKRHVTAIHPSYRINESDADIEKDSALKIVLKEKKPAK